MQLFTIGYEGTSVDRLIATLAHSKVDVLVDVRALPLSRKPGFSKRAFAEFLGAADIDYLHIGDLGDPKPGRDAARAGRYGQFRRIYKAHLQKAAPREALSRLSALAKARICCLLCFERDPAVCHRSIIAAELAERGLTIQHLESEPSGHHAGQSRASRDIGESAAAA